MKKLLFRQRVHVALTLLALVLTAGCAGTPDVRFYLLTGTEPAVSSVAEKGETLVIGLGPVTLPGYLDRSQIVVHVSENRLAADDFHRWAEPLAGNVGRVLAENLAARFSAIRILHYPWERSESPRYRIVVNVLRFDAGPDDAVHLVADWFISGAPAAPRRSDISVTTSLHDFDALVRAESEALRRLSREIGDELLNRRQSK